MFPSTSGQPCAARLMDHSFWGLVRIVALGVVVLLIWLTIELLIVAYPAIQHFGLQFLVPMEWNPAKDTYGMLPQLYGTVSSALIALFIAVPIGLGVAIFANTSPSGRWWF